MSRKSLLKSESAAAIAIAAVLLLGLAFTLISVVKLNYASEWKIDAERDYSYDAWSNMEDVKTRADLFTRFMGSDISYPYGLSTTVPFSMGGGDVPVFEPSKSNSKLAVNTEKCAMTITLAKYPMNPQTVDCGGITYYSKNRQYPDQIFRYENGALILAQGENSQMKRNPSFDIKKIDTNGNYTVIINTINLTGEPKSISSSTSTALRLTGDSIMPSLNSSKDHPNEIIDSFNLSISTRYTDAWTTYLNNTAKDAGLEYGINYTINSTDDNVCLFFLPTSNNYSIYVNQTLLCAELGVKDSSNYTNSGTSDGTVNGHGNRIILNKQEIGGVISSGTYIQFTNKGNNGNNDYSWIKIGNSEKKLNKNDVVKLVIDGDQTSGSADMNSNRITNFNLSVKMYVNGNLVDTGEVTGIWITDYSDYESTLTYSLPSYFSDTQLQVDGVNLISSWPENDSAINLYNIGPATNSGYLTVTFSPNNTYFDCSGDYEIIN